MGILIGYFVFGSIELKKTDSVLYSTNELAMNAPLEENPTEFIQKAAGMLGKTIIVKGTIQEAYKNNDNELVIYLKDNDIPLILNCTLYQSDNQIKWAIKLGEQISLQGKFNELDEQMHLENCLILSRTPN
jgi:hypothetical protein